MSLLIFLAMSWAMPSLMEVSSRKLLARGVGLAGVEGLQGDAALDHLGLQHVEDREDALLGVGLHEDLLAAEVDLGADALEVVALGDLLLGLVQGVGHLLLVHFAYDVERGFASHCASLKLVFIPASSLLAWERGPRALAPRVRRPCAVQPIRRGLTAKAHSPVRA
jgi:hypothetical protein